MSELWHKQCMPTVKEAKASFDSLRTDVLSIPGVKTLYIFGSLAEHINEPDFRIKDIDIIAATPYHSEDLLAIEKDLLSYKIDYLETQPYDLNAIKFTKKITAIRDLPIDAWAISSDKKLLHWGPTLSTKEESDEIKIEAEKFASISVGITFRKLAKADNEKRETWHSAFKSYLHRYFEDMPVGWYQSEGYDLKSILAQAIKIEK